MQKILLNLIEENSLRNLMKRIEISNFSFSFTFQLRSFDN